MISGTTPG